MSQYSRRTGAREMPRRRSGPPTLLMAALAICLAAVLLYFFSKKGSDTTQAADYTPLPSAAATLIPTAPPTEVPTLTPEPTPTPAAQYDYTKPVPESPAVGLEWFDDAVLIGDSRTEGFKLFAGVSNADYLSYTGITVFEVMEGRQVIRTDNGKISVLDALAQKQYGKIYLGLGVNELGYYNPTSYAKTFGELVDTVRASQPNAVIYIQSIVPVNTAKCAANNIPDYVTNEGIASYNKELAAMAAEKEVYLIDIAEALVDETGEVPREDSADGVHFQKQGYIKWRDYLLTHTISKTERT